jgi:hypothetical protein
MVGDTQLSLDRDVHVGPIRHGALKCIVVSPFRCIGFAGNHELAKDALRWCLHNPNATDADVRRRLFDVHAASHAGTDFIFASLSDGGRLDRISDWHVQEGLEAAYIGEQAAFELYQQLYHTDSSSALSGPGQASQMLNALSG